jgi:DNA gyrase/topoisomerase IV subunit B
MSTVDISKKYQLLDEIEHVLKRPGMYIGSTKPHQSSEWLQNEEGRFVKEDVEFNPGFLKLFDEIISNSIDESKRNENLNHIQVNISNKGEIQIWDNGGIPVVMHPEVGMYVPEMIFSNLRAGSNFNDDESRQGAGTNGVGSTLTNIFSIKFRIQTSDGKNEYDQTFENNMSKKTEPKIKPSDKNFTQITYTPDLSRFDMDGINETHIRMLRKRVVDIAACNTGIKITFNKEKFKFRTFKEYADLYTEGSIYERSENWEIAIAPSSNGYQTISYVNSVETKDAGTHINFIQGQIVDKLRQMIWKKHKVDIRPNDIRNHMMLFVNSTIINPAFSSQTKEKLITEPKDFGSTHQVSEKLIKQVFASELVASILDWIERKKEAEERSQLRKLNKNLSSAKILKLIDAKSRNEREKCTLGIFEGMSALSAVRKFRDAQTFGAFPLKGKFLNVSELKNSQIIGSEEVVHLMGSMGLRLGEEPENLRYGKLLIYTDADPDGDAIASLLINFLDKFWPELFDQDRIYKVLTPLVVAKKGKEILYFYSNDEYNTWESKIGNIKQWDIEYKKGLASLEDYEYEEIIKNPRLIKIKNDKFYRESLKAWFGGDSAPRKVKLLSK